MKAELRRGIRHYFCLIASLLSAGASCKAQQPQGPQTAAPSLVAPKPAPAQQIGPSERITVPAGTRVGVVLQNYLKNRDKYNGIGNYNDEGFAYMEKGLKLNADMIKRAVVTPNLMMVMGTDAVAGAHGHNADEIVERVRQGNQKPMDAIIGATSLAAKSMNLDKTIGTLAPGYEADIVAIDGDPLTDITAVTRVAFVMRSGKVYKNVSAGTVRASRSDR